jgi:phospholipid/cholesterol/gamma-HCH transport system substrate-binding protein
MEPEAKYTIVGTAVIVLVALIAAAVVWLRSSGEGADARHYKIYFERQSLEGLELRSYVTMRGIRVGSVSGFRFSSLRPGAVEVFITVEPTTPVRQSTEATVQRHLVTGLATVRLANSTEESPPLSQAPPEEPYPVIAEGESPLQHVSETLTQLAERAGETMQRVNATLSPENRAAFSEVLENLRLASRRADGTLAKLDATLGSLDATLGSLGGAADEVRALARSVAGEARRLAARYDSLGADAGASVREVSEAVRKMSADVERLSRRADALLAGGDDELRATAQSLRSAADSVGAAAGRLRDPRQAIFGPAEAGLGPGERAR